MKRETVILLLLVAVKLALQYLLVAPGYDLHRDEYLHLDQANHMAWGYLSVPPFTSWVSYLILQLGNGVFWVKFFPALFGSLTLVVVWSTVKTLGGGLFAQLLAGVALVFSALLRLNMLYQPTSADVLFWTLVYFALIQYTKSENTKWLWYAAVAFALGFLNKYNIVFLAIGLIAALLLAQRKIFSEKKLYLSALLAFAIVLPNLIWQWQNGFPVVHHMDELTKTQLEKVNRLDFVKEQILFFVGSIFILIGGLLALLRARPFQKYRFVFWSFIFTISVFIILRAKGYYAIGLYPILLAFGAVYWEAISARGPKRRLRPVLLLLPVVVFIPIVKVAFPILPPKEIAANNKAYKELGLLRWEDGKEHELPQDFADMIAWKDMAQIVDNAYATIPNASENTLVLCDNYGQAGAINFYTRHQNLRAVSFSGDYIDWIPKGKIFTNVIAVKDLSDPDPNRTAEIPLFESVRLVGKIEDSLAREFGTRIFVYRGAKADIAKRIFDEAAEVKSTH